MPSHLQNYIVFWYLWLPPITLLFCHYSFWPSVSFSFVSEHSLACPHRRNFFTWNPLDGFCLEPSVKGSSQNPMGSKRIPYIQTPYWGLHPVHPVPSYKVSYNVEPIQGVQSGGLSYFKCFIKNTYRVPPRTLPYFSVFMYNFFQLYFTSYHFKFVQGVCHSSEKNNV